MYDQNPGTDATIFGEAIAEFEHSFEEPVTIRRYVSQPSLPGAFNTQQKATFTDFPATAMVVDMQAAQSMFAAGVLSAGDLVVQMRDRLSEGTENVGGTQQADRLIYRGMEYLMVQRPYTITLGGDVFNVIHLRRTNSQADQGGL